MRDRERGFMEYERKEPGYRPVEQRLQDYHEVERRFPAAELERQVARCMDCGVPFCHGCGCPVYNEIPEFNDAVYHGDWRGALDLLLEGSCFPEFTGRICPAPCETACVLGLNRDPVTIRQIELTIIEKGFERGYMQPRIPERRYPENVAVVGSGPAGLAVADILNRSGYNVVVYENQPRPGGILRYGIPDFKLEKWVLDRRIDLMRQEGVVFECSVRIGEDISYRFLNSRFEAIVLTGGALEPRDIQAPGRELDGIHMAMSFLTQQNKRLAGDPIQGPEINAAGKRVVVIGGGDTGSDCIGTSLRQGAKSCTQLEILPKPPDQRPPSTPWPLWPDRLRTSSSQKEGCDRRWSVLTKAFRGKEGRVKGLDCVELEWRKDPESGRLAPVEIPGIGFKLDAELVLLAMGFVGPGRNRMVEELGLKLDKRGFMDCDADNMTSLPGVFVAGDMSQGASLVVRAIQDGKLAAAGILRYLSRRREGQGS